MKQSIDNYNHDWREAMSWAYTQTEVSQADGKQQVDVSEIIPLEGTPYERLISRNGKPLDAAEQRREDHKYEKALKERIGESPRERAERIEKYEKARAFIDEVPNAYDFKLLGSEAVDGRPAWVVQLTPRAGYIPGFAACLHSSAHRGQVWIDKQDVHGPGPRRR